MSSPWIHSNERKLNGKGKPTMEDVAERAKVCKATVSMVMSNDSRITEATRQKVLETVKTLNYQVNQTARALALRRKPKFGLRTLQPVMVLEKVETFVSEGERKNA
jgi:transcriptional regulator with XRE-family HTH domain